jgi:hypothetical protein
MITFVHWKWFGAMLSVLMVTSCNEVLPARDDLNGLFTTSVSSGFYRTSGVNFIRFFITVKNTTDETIEERADMSGAVSITWIPADAGQKPSVNIQRTIALNKNNIFRADGYSASTGMLRIPPNDSVVFVVYWNMRSNDSTYLPAYWSFMIDNQCDVLYADNGVRKRKIYNRQHFSISASVKLFDRLAILHTAPTTVSECYVVAYVLEANPPQNPCVNINVFNPCSRIGE